MRIFGLVTLAVLISGPLQAQTPDGQPLTPETAQPALEKQARFSFKPVDGGFLRLDSVSGQVALCSQRSAGWACQALPEDRAALEGEIARLQGEVTQLKAQVAAAVPAAPSEPMRPPADVVPRGPDAKEGFKMPSDADISWARERVRHVWRQFVDMVAEMQRDLKK